MPVPGRKTFPVYMCFREVFGIDTRCLAVFRIVIAIILLTDVIFRFPFIQAMYTDSGIFPRTLVDVPDRLLSVQMLSGSYSLQIVHFVVAGVSAVMLLVGCCTRLSTALCWVLTISMHARNEFVLDGGDDLLRSLLLWSLFLPLGSRFSLDSYRSGVQRSEVVCSPATVALMLQFCCLYFFAGWFKVGPEWVDGTAIQHVLDQTRWSKPAAGLLTQHPSAMSMLTRFVVWFEIIGPLCLLIPFRTRQIRMLMVPAFWAFQAGLAATIQLHLFPLVTAAASLPFASTILWPATARSETDHFFQPTKTSHFQKAGNAIVALVAGSLIFWQAAIISAQKTLPVQERIGSLAGWNPVWTMYSTVPKIDFQLSATATLFDDQTVDLVSSDCCTEERRGIQSLHTTYRFRYFQELTLERP